MVIDFRNINIYLCSGSNWIPTIDLIYEKICKSGSRIFSKLDLKAAYHQLRIKKEDRYITSFCNPYSSKTELDQFQFCGAPFGLSFLPSYFQGVIGDVLKDIVG
jgi:hypothetical protein